MKYLWSATQMNDTPNLFLDFVRIFCGSRGQPCFLSKHREHTLQPCYAMLCYALLSGLWQLYRLSPQKPKLHIMLGDWLLEEGVKTLDTTLIFSPYISLSLCGKACGGHPRVGMIESLRCIFGGDNGYWIPPVTPDFVHFAAHINMWRKVMPCDIAEEILALTWNAQ